MIVFLLKAQWGRLKPSRSAAAHYPGGCGRRATDPDRGWTGPHSWQMALGAFGQPGGQGTEVQEKPWGGSRRDKFGKRWRRGSLERSKMLTERAAPTARPRGSHSQSHPEGGLRGLCRAPSRRDAACPSLPLASMAGWLPWCGRASPSLPPSKQVWFFFFSFSPLRKRQSRKLALCSRQGGFEQDNPFGQASNTSV